MRSYAYIELRGSKIWKTGLSALRLLKFKANFKTPDRSSPAQSQLVNHSFAIVLCLVAVAPRDFMNFSLLTTNKMYFWFACVI